MEREDPLEKLERKQADQKANGGLRALMIAMIVVALGLAAALAYVLSSKNKLVNDLNQEKQDLTEQIVALQSDYENLSSEYDTINAQLDSSREEIAQLVDRVKRTEATDRAKIRQYEKELGTLRSIMRGYITQIDSLNTLNHRLTEEAASARKEAEETKEINTRLTQQVEDLTGRVTAGSVLKAHNFVMYAYNNADKITDKANRVVRFLVNLSLVENELAERGPVRVYVRVTDPDGNLLSDGRGTTFTFGGETLEATASREVDYQGQEVDLGIYINNIPSFSKGVYTVNAYTEQAQLGHGELLLR
jgi:FtsZ-binding cell division protein ZapB